MVIVVVSYLLCAVLYLGLAFLLWLHSERKLPSNALILACAVTGLWSLAGLLTVTWPAMGGPAMTLQSGYAPVWVVFLVVAHRVGLPPNQQGRIHWIGLLLIASITLGLMISAATGAVAEGRLWLGERWVRLVLMLAGLVIAEALWRQSRADGYWRISYLCVGVGAILVYDLFITSETLLLRRVDPTLSASQVMVCIIALPLIAVSSARNELWSAELNVARSAIFRVGTFYAMSVYMLLVALAGAAVRSYGGQWGGYAQVSLLVASLVALALAWSSPRFRQQVQRGVARGFFTHRHDYREQWFRFTEALSSPTGGGSLPERTLCAVAQIVDSPGGALWLRAGDVFIHIAGSIPEGADDEVPIDSSIARVLRNIEGSTLDVESGRAGNGRFTDALPDWLLEWSDAWLLVPLVQFDDVVGFVVLKRPLSRSQIDNEDRELLRSAAHHASSTLSSEQTTLRLEEVHHFETLSRGTAYIAHDLRNLANELSLILANARRHLQNPEFQRDLLVSMEESVQGMQRLLDKLNDMPEENVHSRVVDVAGTMRGALRVYEGARPLVQLDVVSDESLLVVCDVDRLHALCGHLIRNAIEAVGPDGRVDVRIRGGEDRVMIEVQDDGPGMDREFLRTRLHHPFTSTKRKGFGLGLYECRDLARAMGGGLTIDSEVGAGTLAKIWLPRVGEENVATSSLVEHSGEDEARPDERVREEEGR